MDAVWAGGQKVEDCESSREGKMEKRAEENLTIRRTKLHFSNDENWVVTRKEFSELLGLHPSKEQLFPASFPWDDS